MDVKASLLQKQDIGNTFVDDNSLAFGQHLALIIAS